MVQRLTDGAHAAVTTYDGEPILKGRMYVLYNRRESTVGWSFDQRRCPLRIDSVIATTVCVPVYR